MVSIVDNVIRHMSETLAETLRFNEHFQGSGRTHVRQQTEVSCIPKKEHAEGGIRRKGSHSQQLSNCKAPRNKHQEREQPTQ